ncbi:MAG: sulfatase [Lentisphaeria bacterium]|nr:sulfatase [Lentisphaeria bacterium]
MKSNSHGYLSLWSKVLIFVVSFGLYAEKAPNFVVFYMDDLGWADTSVEMIKGNKESRSDFHQTPNLERLAKQGMVMSRSYSPAPTCTPSRISIQHGMTNARLQYTTVHDVLAMERKVPEKIKSSYKTIPQIIKEADKGYVTAHFGKGMGLGFMRDFGYDVTDEYDIGENGNFHGDYVDLKSRKHLPEDNPKRIYSLNETCVNFIKETVKTDQPFFMMVSQYSAHVPHMASPRVIEKYRNLPRGKYLKDIDYLDPSEMTKSYRTVAWRLQYAAMLDETDWSLGQIMDAIEEAGIAENTYIIFTSDNGGGLTPNGALTGGKANLYEGGIRVPTVVAGPRVKKGAYCNVSNTQWDLLPTFHELIGSTMPLPETVDGGSLVDIWEKGDEGTVKRDIPGIIFNYPYYAAAPVNAIIVDNYKYMRQLNTGKVMLFDLDKDLSEKNNIAKDMPEKVKQLEVALEQYLEQVDAPKIEDVYPARIRRLEMYKKRAYDKYDIDMKRIIEKAPKAEQAALKAKLDKWLEEDLARQDKNIEHCKLQMKNTKFIGGLYQKAE